jgi:hypothetical protein
MKSLWILGDIYTVKISGDETQGRYSVWEIEAPPNSGPPLHKHSMEDEAFYASILSFRYSIVLSTTILFSYDECSLCFRFNEINTSLIEINHVPSTIILTEPLVLLWRHVLD